MKRLAKVIRSVQAFGRELSRVSSAVAETKRVPAIGLALGGGFARGIAHVGVLKVLEEEGIPVRMIAAESRSRNWKKSPTKFASLPSRAGRSPATASHRTTA